MSAEPLSVPPALCPGDDISIVAPASSPKRDVFDAAMANLTAAGYRPKTYRDVCQPHGYLSGTDAQRADELNEAFADPETTMVLAARGGYGCGRLLDKIDFEQLKQRPKIVCGYSDLTALHAAIQRQAGLISFHGPNLVDGLGDDSKETVIERQAAFAMFHGQSNKANDLFDPLGRMEPGGRAEGPLVGGNAAVLLSIFGTPYEPDFEGAILVLEDVGEAPHRVDRLLTQLRLAGALDRIAGAVIGYFTGAAVGDSPPVAEPVTEIIAEFLRPLSIPTLTKVAVGHEHPNLPLPMGALVRLDADAGTLRSTHPIVSR